MCPLCIGTATLLISSGTSAGGFAALLLKVRARRNAPIALAAGRAAPELKSDGEHGAPMASPSRAGAAGSKRTPT